jgi:ribose/xylose/arabinose/galactoside ABC-type transport system permease subunit
MVFTFITLLNFCVFFYIFKKTRFVRHVASMGQRRGASRVMVGKPFEVSRILGIPRRRWEDNIKKFLK